MRPRWGVARTVLFALGTATAATLTVFVAGFVVFVVAVRSAGPPADPRADGIVVLTGGEARIDGALALLAEGRAGRLLISGVNPAVTEAALARTLAADKRRLLDCCTDLDRVAADTVGNARSTERWTRERGYRSLIVVTSDYHMPRSLAEIAGLMPDTRLVPYPIRDGAPLGEVVTQPDRLRLLLQEYVKYLGARVRLLLGPPEADAAAITLAAPIGR